MKKRIYQLLPTLNPFDAIGNEACVIQDELKKLGYHSEIYAQNIHPSMKNKAKNYQDYKKSEDTNEIFIYHHSIGSDLFDFILSLDSKIIMIYHNVTPPEFFEGTNNVIADLLKQGKIQLEKLKTRIDLAVGDSEYSRLELEKIGYKKTGVFPILFDMKKYKQKPDQTLISKYKKSTNILYVGRIAPNKNVEEIIKIFHYYSSNINPNSNLFLVGRFDGVSDSYYQLLQSLIHKAEIKNIHIITDADDKKLVTLYSMADLFIIMSKHEGFCVPLVESMIFKIPIIANNSTAIPYTLDGAGFLTSDETFEEIGELVDVILGDESIKLDIVQKQTKRLSTLYEKDNKTMLDDLIRQVIKY